MAYAHSEDVLARAGRVRAAFGSEDAPSPDELEAMCETVSAELDARLGGLQLTTPVVEQTAREALRDVVADGVLVRAMPGAFPSEAGWQAVSQLVAEARRRYERAVASISAGTHSVVVLLQSQLTGTEGMATNFWDDNPLYDQTRVFEEAVQSPSVLPATRRSTIL